MQYLLSKEELDALRPQSEVEIRNKALEAAKNEILKQASFTCIHKEVGRAREWAYCDDCPCSSIGNGRDYKLYELICTDSKSYSA